MLVTLFSTDSTDHTRSWVVHELASRDHEVVDVRVPDDQPRRAAVAGNHAADSWFLDPPDCALALGWEAGLAAHVAAREPGVPVVVRLNQAARRTSDDQARLEVALARSSARVLVPSTGELDRVAELGVPRQLLRVVPEALDLRRVRGDASEDTSRVNSPRRHRVAATSARAVESLRRLPGCEPVILAEPPTVAGALQVLQSVDVLMVDDDGDRDIVTVLLGMACGVPAVAREVGALADVVADGVTGVLVPRHADVTAPLRSLLADPVRRQGMGMAAVDRVHACFASTVVGAALDRVLTEVSAGQEVGAI